MVQRRENGVPTIKDIARVCGVSEATVSYVINGKRVLKADTRERVFQVMREMNYHPSAVARGLSGKKAHTLGVLFPVIESTGFVTNPYATGLLQGVFLQAQREGFNVTLFTSNWENAQVSAPPLRDGRTNGVLVIAPPLGSDILSRLASLHVPVVGISAPKHAGVAVVDVDDEAGVQLATQHLIELGHRCIAYLTGNTTPRLMRRAMPGFARRWQRLRSKSSRDGCEPRSLMAHWPSSRRANCCARVRVPARSSRAMTALRWAL